MSGHGCHRQSIMVENASRILQAGKRGLGDFPISMSGSGLVIDPADIVENFPDGKASKPFVPKISQDASHYHQTSSGVFIASSSSKRDITCDRDVHRFFSSVLAAAEISLVCLACVWVYGVTASASDDLEPALSTSVRFFLVIVCFKTILLFADLKTVRAAIAPIFYLAAYITAIAAAPDDTEISGNYKSLVWARAVLIWAAFVVSKFAPLAFCV